MNDRTKDYVFLSYSHKDDISGILEEFRRRGYNVVYDDAMSYGEEWDLNARRYIGSDKCKGVVFLVSENFLVSKSVLTETEYAARFRKKSFCVLMQGMTVPELRHSLYGMLDDDRKYIMDSISEAFPPEQIYVKRDSLAWDRVQKTFADWGFFREEEPFLQPLRYTSALKGEKTRLESQQRGYHAFDMRAIGLVLSEFDRDGLVVLDLGCSNGALTISRFADSPRIAKVIGIDYDSRDIEEATRAAAPYGDKFCFRCMDLEQPGMIDELKGVLRACGQDRADIVFGALVLHHLRAPSKLLLRLYDVLSDDGKIILRGSDDGGKLCYPKTELLQEILTRYGKIVTSSDRSNGRKLYSQLFSTGYVGIRMLYSVVDTCEKDRRSRENLFQVGFSFRLNQIDELLKKNPGNEELKREREWFAKALAEFKEAFVDRSFWYANTSYIAIAGVK